MNEIDLQTRTLYAELLELMQIHEASRSASCLKGSFYTKEVNDTHYVYFQHYDVEGKLKQIYIGKQGELADKLINPSSAVMKL